MRTMFVTAALLHFSFLAQAPVAGAVCMGDADLDGRVHVDEIIVLTDCALQRSSGCQRIFVDDIVTAIDKALKGCDPAWLDLTPCRQCEGCLAAFEDVLFGNRAGLPEELLPADVNVLDSDVFNPEFVCFACGCPAGPTYSVLVRSTDVKRLLEIGWTIDR